MQTISQPFDSNLANLDRRDREVRFMSNLTQLDSPQDAAMLLTIVRSETARSQVYHRSGLSLARRRLNMQQATESQVLLELDRRRAL